MSREACRYRFNETAPLKDVEESLLLAIVAAECLHGESRVRLDVSYCISKQKRACVVDTSTPAGEDVNSIFTGFISREFGEEAFQVQRISVSPTAIEENPSEEDKSASPY